MICPRCDTEMTESCFGPVSLDFCRSGCGGLWFDWGELACVDEPGEGLGEALDAALAHELVSGERVEPLRCPRCAMPMREHRYKNVPGVLIDECYGCRGLFLDGGELRRVRDALGERRRRERKVERLLEEDVPFRLQQIAGKAELERARAMLAITTAITRKVPFVFLF